jgi:hypothetical protein
MTVLKIAAGVIVGGVLFWAAVFTASVLVDRRITRRVESGEYTIWREGGP